MNAQATVTFPKDCEQALELILGASFRFLEDGMDEFLWGLVCEDFQLQNNSQICDDLVSSDDNDFVIIKNPRTGITRYEFLSVDDTYMLDIEISNGTLYQIVEDRTVKLSSSIYTVYDLKHNIVRHFTVSKK